MKCQKFCLALILAFIGRGSCSNDDVRDIGRKMEPGWVWNAKDYPNPKTDFTKCQQSKPSTICDPDSLLTTSDLSQLNDLIQRLSSTSPCLCKDNCAEDAHNKGLIVGVALMTKFYHPYHEDKTVAAKKMSQDIVNSWNLGTCNNEILILISSENQVANFETGDAVKEFIPEETIEEIFVQCKDYFTDKEFYSGLQSIINSLYDSIQAKILKAAAANDDADTKTGSTGLIVGLVVGAACLAAFAAVGFMVIRRSRRRTNNQNGFMYDGSNGRQGIRSIKRDMIGPIVKTPVVFPDAVYQPCSIDDGRKGSNKKHQAGSDDEDDIDNEDHYLRRLEENPAYEATGLPRELSVVEEVSEHEPKTPPVVVVDALNNLNKLQSSQENKDNAGYA